jgi:hypothetical protein
MVWTLTQFAIASRLGGKARSPAAAMRIAAAAARAHLGR